jgi:transposase
VADKAFDIEPLRQLLRWLIERTFNWLHQFRRLCIRWERSQEVHQAFLSLATTAICYRIWINAT